MSPRRPTRALRQKMQEMSGLPPPVLPTIRIRKRAPRRTLDPEGEQLLALCVSFNANPTVANAIAIQSYIEETQGHPISDDYSEEMAVIPNQGPQVIRGTFFGVTLDITFDRDRIAGTAIDIDSHRWTDNTAILMSNGDVWHIGDELDDDPTLDEFGNPASWHEWATFVGNVPGGQRVVAMEQCIYVLTADGALYRKGFYPDPDGTFQLTDHSEPQFSPVLYRQFKCSLAEDFTQVDHPNPILTISGGDTHLALLDDTEAPYGLGYSIWGAIGDLGTPRQVFDGSTLRDVAYYAVWPCEMSIMEVDGSPFPHAMSKIEAGRENTVGISFDESNKVYTWGFLNAYGTFRYDTERTHSAPYAQPEGMRVIYWPEAQQDGVAFDGATDVALGSATNHGVQLIPDGADYSSCLITYGWNGQNEAGDGIFNGFNGCFGGPFTQPYQLCTQESYSKASSPFWGPPKVARSGPGFTSTDLKYFTDVEEIVSAGRFNILVRRGDGTLWGWGHANFGWNYPAIAYPDEEPVTGSMILTVGQCGYTLGFPFRMSHLESFSKVVMISQYNAGVGIKGGLARGFGSGLTVGAGYYGQTYGAIGDQEYIEIQKAPYAIDVSVVGGGGGGSGCSDTLLGSQMDDLNANPGDHFISDDLFDYIGFAIGESIEVTWAEEIASLSGPEDSVTAQVQVGDDLATVTLIQREGFPETEQYPISATYATCAGAGCSNSTLNGLANAVNANVPTQIADGVYTTPFYDFTEGAPSWELFYYLATTYYGGISPFSWTVLREAFPTEFEAAENGVGYDDVADGTINTSPLQAIEVNTGTDVIRIEIGQARSGDGTGGEITVAFSAFCQGGTSEPATEPLPPMQPDPTWGGPTNFPLDNPWSAPVPTAGSVNFDPDGPPYIQADFPFDGPPDIGDDFTFAPPDPFDLDDWEPPPFYPPEWSAPIGDWGFGNPSLDPCNFDMPNFDGGLCGPRDPGGSDWPAGGGAGGLLGTDPFSGDNSLGGGGGTVGGIGGIGGGVGDYNPGPDGTGGSKYTDSELCFTDEPVTAIIEQMAFELGIDPSKVIIDPDGVPCDETYTGCFPPGTNKFEILKKMAAICGYGVVDTGGGVIILPPGPTNVHHILTNYTDIFVLERVNSDADLYHHVEVFRPAAVVGGVYHPLVSKVALVTSPFNPPIDSVKYVRETDYNLTDSQLQNLANVEAGKTSGLGARSQITTLWQKGRDFALYDQVHLRRYDINWYTRWMIRSMEHTFSGDGHLTLAQLSWLGFDPTPSSLPPPVDAGTSLKTQLQNYVSGF